MAGFSKFGVGTQGRARAQAAAIQQRFTTAGAASRPAPRAAPRVVATARPLTIAPRGGEFITHYDPSRVIDLDRLKVVDDLRAPKEFAAERGETQSGDEGVMSPSESAGGGRGMPGTTATPTTAKAGGGGLILAALAAALLLGG